MDSEPISYNYNGETILIYPGHLFTKNELISRLKEMNFALVDDSYEKQDLVVIYEIATSYQKNIEKIIPKLKKDDKYMKLKERLQKNNKIEPNNNGINSFFKNLKSKLLFSNTSKEVNNLNDDNEKKDKDNDNNSSSNNSYLYSFSTYLLKKLFKLLYKCKFSILKIAFLIMFYYSLKNFTESSSRGFVRGMILRNLFSIITLKRYLMFILIIYIIRFITNSLIYCLFAFFGFGTIFYIFRESIPNFY